MSATDELRRLLDERGVEWWDGEPYGAKAVTFFTVRGVRLRYVDYGDYCWLDYHEDEPLTPEQAIAATLGPKVTGETSDGYHTFSELYHHRAVLFSVIVRDHRELAWKSKAHHDGTMYEGMFIVGIETPEGQATYHYDIDPYWDMFDCKEFDQAPEWDGHSPGEAIERIAALGTGTCRIRNEECDQCGAIIHEHANMYWAPVGEGMRTVKHRDVHFCPNCGRRVVSE